MSRTKMIFLSIIFIVFINCFSVFSCGMCRLVKSSGKSITECKDFKDLMPGAVDALFQWPSNDNIKKMTNDAHNFFLEQLHSEKVIPVLCDYYKGMTEK